MKLGFEKKGRCEICGTEVYDPPSNKRTWKKAKGGIVHLDCLRREEEQQKENKKLEAAVL